ncbi:MAG: T9SS type A sorting domain-containing protein [Parafilimonas sp.]|nr:T9SS type A sorting domain-containing protein [Parafilimonas sp.]
MKKILLFSTVIFFVFENVHSQCNLSPTIVPKTLIFCPNATDTLVTKDAYDTYQWYRNGIPIAGATNRYLILHQQQDEGYFYKVVVTKGNCRDTSKHILADGYAFLPPDLIETGDIGVYDPRLDALVECPRDTLILTLSSPYTEKIQWYNNYKPIPGANQQSYYVTSTGSYTVCGSPEVCPNYKACETLPLNASFENPVATITESGDTLFASAAKKYQWYLYGNKIPGATMYYYVPKVKGNYTVVTTDKYKCAATSDPYNFRPDNKTNFSISPNPVKNVLHVHIASKLAKQIVVADLYGNQKLKALITGIDQTITLQNLNAGTYVVQIVNAAGLRIASSIVIKQ